jgi:transposase-like protein
MASLSGEKTLAQLSVEFGVHPTMISNWKQELVKRAGELFARGSKAPAEDAQKVIRRSASQDRSAAGRVRFSCRAARHLPIAARRAMIAPEAGLSVSRTELDEFILADPELREAVAQWGQAAAPDEATTQPLRRL